MLKLLSVVFIINFSYSEDLGIVAKTYPIAEPDMIAWIKSRANNMIQSGQWQQLQRNAVANTQSFIKNPEPVADITDATANKTWYYTPMIDLKEDLTDTQGNLIAKKGLYNALRYKPFDTQLLFINGNNPKQVSWAISQSKQNKSKIILTQGSFMQLDKKYKVWFYYDQNGKYTQKLNITHVPAIVKQSGTQLGISEIDNKDL